MTPDHPAIVAHCSFCTKAALRRIGAHDGERPATAPIVLPHLDELESPRRLRFARRPALFVEGALACRSCLNRSRSPSGPSVVFNPVSWPVPYDAPERDFSSGGYIGTAAAAPCAPSVALRVGRNSAAPGETSPGVEPSVDMPRGAACPFVRRTAGLRGERRRRSMAGASPDTCAFAASDSGSR